VERQSLDAETKLEDILEGRTQIYLPENVSEGRKYRFY
jgi:hypothetical protein